MRVYLQAIKFNFLVELAYPHEIISYFIRKLINLGFLVLFWHVLSQTNSEIFEFKKLVSYFLISQAITDLTFTTAGRFGRSIQKIIAKGELSNFLLKPADTVKLMFANYIGVKTTVAFYAVVTLIIGLIISPPPSAVNYLMFLVSLVFTTIAGLGINLFIGIVGFYTPEAGGIQNMYDHASRILSGAVIPLDYFPPILRTIATLSPFPVLVYFPTTILMSGGINLDTLYKFGLSIFWAFVLFIGAVAVWRRSLKLYEGVGI